MSQHGAVRVTNYRRDFNRLGALMDVIEAQRSAPRETGLDETIVAQMLERLAREGVIYSGQKALEAGWTPGHGAERLRNLGLDVQELCSGQSAAVTESDVRVLADPMFSNLPAADFDLIWSRQVLQQSLMPYPTLCEYRRLLKPGGHVYVELPAPDTARQHQTAPGNFSVMGQTQWVSLFLRAGFTVVWAVGMNYPVAEGKDVYWAFLLQA